MVTGGGRGIGRAYAHLLAERGANVVVNDLGVSVAGEGKDDGPAAEVASEIGGLADTNDVSSVDGARALIATAVDQFGRIDILVNNAGIMRWAGPPKVDAANLADHLDVHVGGSFNTALAAWPHMVDQGYGRIVMTTSSGMFGLPNNLSYATAKAGTVGMTRSLARAGDKHGIKVNAIAPAAMTRMSPGAPEPDPRMAPELVAPMVAYLAHETCPVSGETYAAGAGRFARIFIGCTEGLVDPEATVEDIVAHWALINDEKGYEVPFDLMAWSASYLSHLED